MLKKILILLSVLVLTSCAAPNTQEDTINKPIVVIKEDFKSTYHLGNWTYNNNDISNISQPNYLVAATRDIGVSMPYKGLELYLNGIEDYHFITLSRNIDNQQLKKNTPYLVNVHFQLATNLPNKAVDIKGAPGLSTYIKLGLLSEKPELSPPYNFDYGMGSKSGKDLITLDHVGCDKDSEDTDYVLKTYTQSFKGSTNDQGKLWLIIALESFYPGDIKLYLSDIEIEVFEENH